MTDQLQPVTGRTRDVVIWIDKAVFRLAKHWLALANLVMALYVGLPLLAPVFMHAGWTVPAKVIYTIYRPLCHQHPDRSYFLYGPRLYYSPDELVAAGVEVGLLSRDIGNETVGWKVAICERDVAIYGSIFLGGLAYGLVRHWRARGRRRTVRFMPIRYFVLFCLPMAVDGTLQLFGVYESNWLLRTVTGSLFGLGVVFFSFPYLEAGFDDVRQSVNTKLHLEPDPPGSPLP